MWNSLSLAPNAIFSDPPLSRLDDDHSSEFLSSLSIFGLHTPILPPFNHTQHWVLYLLPTRSELSRNHRECSMCGLDHLQKAEQLEPSNPTGRHHSLITISEPTAQFYRIICCVAIVCITVISVVFVMKCTFAFLLQPIQLYRWYRSRKSGTMNRFQNHPRSHFIF